jgi:hypothetical protein
MVEPIRRVLTPEAARQLLDVRADEETQRRIDDLAEKCTEGSLTSEERSEYQGYISSFNFLTLLQAKARTFLDGSNGK